MPSVPRITKEELKQQLDGPAESRPLVVDVRLKYPYEHSTVTLPGAVRLSAGAVSDPQLPQGRTIVVYDSDPQEIVAERFAADLLARGYRAMALAGGIAEWVTAKLPTDSKPAPQGKPPAPGALKS